jgi:hypothetical protein
MAEPNNTNEWGDERVDDGDLFANLHTGMIPAASRELTDEEVFGPKPRPGELSDAEVFGPKPGELSYDEVAGRQPDFSPLTFSNANPLALSPAEAFGRDPGDVPAAFYERVRRGAAVERTMKRVATGFAEGWGPEPLGISPEHMRELIDAGIFTDPITGKPGSLDILSQAAIGASANTLDFLMRSVKAGVFGAAGIYGQMIEEMSGSEAAGVMAERDARMYGQLRLIEGGMGDFARPVLGSDQIIRMQPIGGLPTAADFRNAAAAIGEADPFRATTEANLRQLWWTKGVHPAEAVADASVDAFMKDTLTEGAPQSAGAAVTPAGAIPTPAEQPLPPPGSVLSRLRGIGSDIMGLGRNLEMLVNPMVTGSRRAMVAAKDYADTIRRIDWEWSRQDDDILRRFDHESRERMFTAMDEESVARQLSESTEHQGLVTLEPEERALVEDLDARQQAAWLAARDLGMVEGDGLPMHATRYVLNMANADGNAPLALDTIGRNLTVRTSQMLHRKYMTIEETEAAAKQLVTERLTKAGATPEQIAAATEKVEVARDIRAVALSTAKLEKAIAGRTLINGIKEIGEAAGDTLVSEDEAPGFFTLNHPALRTWRPKFQHNPVDGTVSVIRDDAGNIVFEPRQLHIADEFKGPLMSILDEPVVKHPLAQTSQSVYQAVMTLKGKAMTAILNSPLIHNAVIWGKVMPSAPGQWLGFRLYWTGNRIANDAARSRQLVERGLAPVGHRGSFQDITSVMEEPQLKPGRSWTSQVLALVPDLFDPKAGNAVRRAIDRAGDFWHNTLLWDRVRDVQFGLADHMSRNLRQSGMDAVAADRVASYFANAVVGSIPKEAMSTGARQIANVMMFSRSFTLGNLQVLKTAVTGLPKPVLAQVERDLGASLGEAGAEAAVKKLSGKLGIGTAARMAAAIVAIDFAVAKVVNSLIQNAVNVSVNSSDWGSEARGYLRRLQQEANRITTTPWELLNPLNFNENALGLPGRISATSENEPGKENRIFIGYAPDGTALYARNPIGKYPEEITGWLTAPFDTARAKMSPLAGGTFDVLFNTAGMGHKVYDPTAETTMGRAHNMALIVEHMIGKNLPEMQIAGAKDLLMGDGDLRTNWLRVMAPALGFTASQGAPGGPAKGEVLAERSSFQAKFDLAWPNLRKAIRRGDMDTANAAMQELHIPPAMYRTLIRAARDPGHISARTLREFMYRATPEEQERYFRLHH